MTLTEQLRSAAAAAAILVAAGCTSTSAIAPDSTVVMQTGSLGAPDSVFTGATQERDYRIGPLDQLDVSVFGQDQLKSSVEVDSTGHISLPLIGEVEAGGKTTGELEAAIADRLKEYVRDPQVNVAVKEAQSQKVTIEGAVTQPGVYALAGRTTLLQAVAMAHGFNEVARLDGVVVFRTVNGQKMAARFDVAGIRTGKYPDPEVFGNDLVEVDESAGKRELHDVLQLLPIVSVFRFWP